MLPAFPREPLIMLNISPASPALSRANPARRARPQHNRVLDIQPDLNLSTHPAPIAQPSGRAPSRQCANSRRDPPGGPGVRAPSIARRSRLRSRLSVFPAGPPDQVVVEPPQEVEQPGPVEAPRWGRTGAPCRDCSRWVSPARPPHPPCASPRNGRSTCLARWSAAARLPVPGSMGSGWCCRGSGSGSPRRWMRR